MAEHNPKIVPELLGKTLRATSRDNYPYVYIFIPRRFFVNQNGNPLLDVFWQHFPMRPGVNWMQTETSFNKYDYEVLDANFRGTGTVFRAE